MQHVLEQTADLRCVVARHLDNQVLDDPVPRAYEKVDMGMPRGVPGTGAVEERGGAVGGVEVAGCGANQSTRIHARCNAFIISTQ